MTTAARSSRSSSDRPSRALSAVKTLYVLLNNKIAPTFAVTPNETLAVGTRSLSTVLRREVQTNVQAANAYARRRGIAFNFSAIPGDYDDSAADSFDPDFMRRLFDDGVAAGRSASPWSSAPPAPPALAGNAKRIAQR